MQGFLAGTHAIEGFGAGGFRFAGLSHQGSILITPETMRSWEALKIEEIDVEGLTAVFSPFLPLDMVVIGLGVTMNHPLRFVIERGLRQHLFKVEAMDTPAALRTYNVLLAEGRRVAAAFLGV